MKKPKKNTHPTSYELLCDIRRCFKLNKSADRKEMNLISQKQPVSYPD